MNNRNTRAMCEICSKLTIKTPEPRHKRRSGVFIVNFEQISHIVLLFLLLTLKTSLPAGSGDSVLHSKLTLSSTVPNIFITFLTIIAWNLDNQEIINCIQIINWENNVYLTGRNLHERNIRNFWSHIKKLNSAKIIEIDSAPKTCLAKYFFLKFLLALLWLSSSYTKGIKKKDKTIFFILLYTYPFKYTRYQFSLDTIQLGRKRYAVYVTHFIIPHTTYQICPSWKIICKLHSIWSTRKSNFHEI